MPEIYDETSSSFDISRAIILECLCRETAEYSSYSDRRSRLESAITADGSTRVGVEVGVSGNPEHESDHERGNAVYEWLLASTLMYTHPA